MASNRDSKDFPLPWHPLRAPIGRLWVRVRAHFTHAHHGAPRRPSHGFRVADALVWLDLGEDRISEAWRESPVAED